MKTKPHIFHILIALFFNTSIVFCQEGSSELPSIAYSSVHIVNNTNQLLNFAIRAERGQWDSYSLASGSNTTISCNGCAANFFEFTMSTDGREVRYDLDSGKRYVLEWNGTKRLWDIFLSR